MTLWGLPPPYPVARITVMDLMGFWRRKKRPRLTRSRCFIAAVAQLTAQWTDTADGKVMIRHPRPEDWVGKMVALSCFHVPQTRQLVLDDGVGSSVWRIYDGEHTIKDCRVSL